MTVTHCVLPENRLGNPPPVTELVPGLGPRWTLWHRPRAPATAPVTAPATQPLVDVRPRPVPEAFLQESPDV